MTRSPLRRLAASPLANALALDALALLLVAAAETHPATALVLRTDPAARLPGAALLGLAWFTLRLAPSVSTGHRRLVARAAGALLLALGALHGAGPGAVAAVELAAGPWASGARREALAAAVALVASAWSWATSPALRG